MGGDDSRCTSTNPITVERLVNYKYNPPPAELLTGQIDAAVLEKGGAYVAWTKDWQGPGRPDLPAAKSDLLDRFDAEASEVRQMIERIA